MVLERCYPANAAYGTGIYRRRIALDAVSGAVAASVLDSYHDMSCFVHHDGEVVTAIQGAVRRAPFTTCPAAPAALDEVVGLPLATLRALLYGAGRAGRNCTHLLDIAALAMALAASGANRRRFDLVIPDELDGRTVLEALVDGAAIHRWTLSDGVMVAPDELAGQALFGGFARFAASRLTGVALDAALQLQKAAFVARGRRVLLDRPIGVFHDREPERVGACYTFSEPQLSIARDAPGFTRDFTRALTETAAGARR